MPLVPDRLWELMTEEERERVQDAVDGFRFQPVFRCPNCQAEVKAKLRVTFGEVLVDNQEKTPPMVRVPDLTAEDRALLASAKSSGMFDAYERALREERQDQAPKSLDAVERLFLKFFDLAVPLKGCDGAKRAYRASYQDNGPVEFVQSNAVVGILQNRTLVEFAPLRFFKVPPGQVALKSPQVKAEEWIKTKFGYIPKSASAFASAMRVKAVGAFGRLVQ